MSTLHTVNKSPFGNGTLLSCLNHCKPGDAVLLIEDGVYGALQGRVARIGADAAQDEATGEIYFPIVVETDSNQLERQGEVHSIKPGMVASVDILTGERTVLDYLLKPFRKARLEAMRER